MKIALIGAGKVGGTLGRRFAEVGHDVVYGVRVTDDPKHAALRGCVRPWLRYPTPLARPSW